MKKINTFLTLCYFFYSLYLILNSVTIKSRSLTMTCLVPEEIPEPLNMNLKEEPDKVSIKINLWNIYNILVFFVICPQVSFSTLVLTYFLFAKRSLGYRLFSTSKIGPGTDNFWDSTDWGVAISKDNKMFVSGWYAGTSSAVSGGTDTEPSGWLRQYSVSYSGVTRDWDVEYLFNGYDYFLSVDADTDGGCIVAGFGADLAVRGNVLNIFLRKMDSSGAVVWTWYADKTWGYKFPQKVKTLSNGEYIVAGVKSNGNPFILRMSKSHTLIWRYDTTYDTGFIDVEEASDGSLMAITGYPHGFDYEFTNYFKYSTTELNYHGQYRCSYTKLTSGGLLVYTKTTNILGYCNSIKKTKDGGFIIAGWISGSTDDDGWAYRIDKNGNYVWEESVGISGDDYALGVNEMENNDIVWVFYERMVKQGIVILDSMGVCINLISSSASSYYIYTGVVREDGLAAIGGHALDSMLYTRVPCPSGTSSTLTSGCTCNPCQPGYYQPGIDRSSCLPCSVMMFQDLSGQISCKNCAEAHYQDLKGQPGCKDCILNCKSCTTGTNCLLCYSPYYLHTLDSTTNVCVKPCPDYFYGTVVSGISVCKNCLANCISCTSATSCTKCGPGYFIDNSVVGATKCVTVCPSKYFGNTTTMRCENCLSNCLICVDSIHCLGCSNPLAIKHGEKVDIDTCVSDCGLRYFIDSKYSPRTCFECDFRCLSCTDYTSNACPNCDLSKVGVIKSGINLCDCGEGYVTNLVTKSCKVCEDNLCIRCSPDNTLLCSQCVSSVANLILDPINKVCTCGAGFYRSGDVCKSCNTFCSECTGPTFYDCLPNKCKNGAYPLDISRNACLYMCQTAQGDLYINSTSSSQKLCMKCVAPCKSCFAGNSEACTSCRIGEFLFENTCIAKCLPKYYSDSSTCLPCDPKCANCTGRVNYCIDGCETPYLYKDHFCLADCGIGYTPMNGFCEPCNTGCSICTYKDSVKVCQRCVIGKYLFEGNCVSLCLDGYYADPSTGLCTLCYEACSLCFGGTNRNCYSCNTTLGYIAVAENTCSYPSCTDGSYFNIPLKACLSCPKECSKCIGSYNCTECAKGYNFDYAKKLCYDPCNKLGFKRKADSFECEEICGDGRNMGALECDDGNTKDNDGCSSTCKVEKYYECSDGNADSADICVYRKKIDVKVFKYSGSQLATVTFDTRIKILDELDNIISFTLERAEKSEVEWTYEPFDKNNFNMIKFNFKFSCSLTGAEDLVLHFDKPEKFEDTAKNTLGRESVKAKVAKYRFISEGEKKGAEGAGTASLYAMLPSMALSLGLSFIFNTPIEGMWAMVSVLQMMSYMTLIDLYFPENLLAFLKCIESVHDFNKWFPNPFTYLFPPNKLNISPYNEQFEKRGFSNRNTVYLCGSDLIIMGATALLILVLIPLPASFKYFCCLSVRMCKKLLGSLRYSSISRSFIQAYLKIAIATTINIGIYDMTTIEKALTSILSMLGGCFLICIPSLISDFLFLNRNSAKHNKEFRATYSIYIDGFKFKRNVLNLMFYPIYMFRRLTFAATIVLLADVPALQLAFTAVETLSFLAYVIYFKPFKSIFSYFSTISSEFAFFVFTILLSCFIKPKSDRLTSILGWGMVALVVVAILCSWIFVVTQQLKSYQRKAKKKTTKKVQNKKKAKKSISALNKVKAVEGSFKTSLKIEDINDSNICKLRKIKNNTKRATKIGQHKTARAETTAIDMN